MSAAGSRRAAAWVPLAAAIVSVAALAGTAAWRVSLQAIDSQIAERRGALKRLGISGGIPPTQEVMDYLTSREAVLQERYRAALEAAASASPVAGAASADPQLYFQERFHEMQRMVERLSTARAMPAPELLGFPKELPPSDTVARLLIQVSVIQETAAMLLEQGVSQLGSFKIEDPETVPDEEHRGSFLLRVPVRVRFSATLPQVVKILAALERVRPLVDVRDIHLAQGAAPGSLDGELLLARYLVIDANPPPAPAAPAVVGRRAGRRTPPTTGRDAD